MANEDRRNGAGVVFGVSNEVIAIIGGVAIIGIGAHLLGEWLKPKRPRIIETIRSGPDSMPPTIIDAMYGEIADNATNPSQVHANRDRVHAAIKQRIPRLQQLSDRHAKGEIGPDKLAQGIQRNAHDVMDDLGIPSSPHPAAASPPLVKLFQNQRAAEMSRRYYAPGQLILNTPERRYLEHQAMSMAATTDPIERHRKKEAIKDAREAARLAALTQKHQERQQFILQKHLEQIQDKQARLGPSGAMQGSWYPLG